MADDFALQMAAMKVSVPAPSRFRDEGLCLIGVWHGGGYAWRGSHPFTVIRPYRKRTAALTAPGAVSTRPRAQCFTSHVCGPFLLCARRVGRLATAVGRLDPAPPLRSVERRHCMLDLGSACGVTHLEGFF